MKTAAVLAVLAPVVAALSFLLGCSCSGVDHLDLAAEWRPLKRIQHDAGTPPGILRTWGDVVLTGDVCAFQALSPDEQHGLLVHERLHALHQQEQGLAPYLRDFGTDRAFRWQEESAGWRLEIEDHVRLGVRVDPFFVAQALSENYDHMIGYDPALVWAVATITHAGGQK